MARAGAVWIDVLPSMKNWNSSVKSQANASLGGVGEASGKSFTSGMLRSLKAGNAEVSAQMKALGDQMAADTRAAASKVTAARKREADAAGQVRVAETKLQELRTNENAKASQIAAAEERLAKAQRTHMSATEALTTATSNYSASLLREEEVSNRAGEAASVSSGKFAAMAGAVSGGASRMTSKLGEFAKGAAAMGGIFAGFEAAHFAGESIKTALSFQKSSQVLVTAASESMSNLAMVRSGLMRISSETGTSLDQMTEGMYTVEKAGIRGAKGLAVMEAAAKGAKDEGADLGVVTNALTTIMTTSGGQITVPAKAMNALMVAAGHSKTTLQEFSDALGNVLPVASKAGLSFDQISGAISAMTASGMSARRATMQLNHAVVALINPNTVQSDWMQAFGISSDNVREKLGTRGLQGTINYLSAAVNQHLGPAMRDAQMLMRTLNPDAKNLMTQFKQGTVTVRGYQKGVDGLHGVSAQQKKDMLAAIPALTGYQQAMAKMLGGSVGLQVAMMLTGKQAKIMAGTTEDVGKAMNSTADFDKKWGITSKSTANALAVAKTSIDNVGVSLATKLLPGIAKVATGFANGVMAVQKFSSQNWSWMRYVALGLGMIVAGLTAFKIAAGISGLVTGLATSMGFMTAATETSAAAWVGLDGAMDANPVGLVIAAIAALAIGLIYAYKHSETFRNIVNGAFQAVGASAKWLWQDAIRPYLKFVIDLWLETVGVFVNGAAKAFGWLKVGGIGSKLKAAAAWFNDFKDSVNASLSGIHSTINIKMHYDTGKGPLTPGGVLTGAGLHNNKPPVTHRAAGGPIYPGLVYKVGEHGSEYITPGVPAVVHAHGESTQMSKKVTLQPSVSATAPRGPQEVHGSLDLDLGEGMSMIGVMRAVARDEIAMAGRL